MKIEFWQIGKTKENYIIEGTNEYLKRISRFHKVEIITIPDVKKAKNLSPKELKGKEGKLVLNKISSTDILILLDENGTSFSSEKFAQFLQHKMSFGGNKLVFLIGGAYGFSPEVYARANNKISLSKMTFSHQMIRMFFMEQLYRGFTILNHVPYHNN